MACQRGFTLLELMVVVVIIGIVFVGALLSLGSSDNDSQLIEERERLGALIDYARERGAMATVEYGIQVVKAGYGFSYFDTRSNQWLPETLDEPLRPRPLPPGLALQLDVEGHAIVLSDAVPTPDDKQHLKDYTPQILLYANGDTNDFALTMRRVGQARRFTIASKGAGSIDYGAIVSKAP